jgi:hypothetical protein
MQIRTVHIALIATLMLGASQFQDGRAGLTHEPAWAGQEAEAWSTSDLAWEDRRSERFAETIAWGLYDQLRRPTLIDASCAELHADFLFITGHPALGPVEPVCAPDEVSGAEQTTTLPGVEEIREVRADPGLDASNQELVDFALERFAKAGLELPPELVISFPEDQSRCLRYGGLYVPRNVEVRICRPSKSTMVHELAHAWIETTLSEAARQEFLELRGLATWKGGPDWDGRGAEHAAEVLTWALMDRNITLRWLEPGPNDTSMETFRLIKIENSTHEELVDAYQLLTGTDPVDRSARSPTADTGSDLSSPEARRSALGRTINVGGLQDKGAIGGVGASRALIANRTLPRCVPGPHS